MGLLLGAGLKIWFGGLIVLLGVALAWLMLCVVGGLLRIC